MNLRNVSLSVDSRRIGYTQCSVNAVSVVIFRLKRHRGVTQCTCISALLKQQCWLP
uniref:Uncharacterized protein n=1 Tax=Anguilla anguilla TaxID=7936 RepID=A0A0E9WZ41_ANGAN